MKLVNASHSIGRNFRLVWLSMLVSSSGDGMFITAFPLLAALLTRDPILIAGVTISTRLPWLIFSLPAGAIADRTDRRKLMITANLMRFAIVAVLGLSIVFDFISIWGLYLSAFLLGACETAHVNAAQAIIPAIVKPEHLLTANARFSTAQIVATQFVGPSLGVTLFNIARALPFLADAVTFLGSAGLIAAVPDEHGVERPTTRFRDDILEGLRFTRDSLPLRRLTEIVAVINFFYFGAVSLLVLYTQEILNRGNFVFTALSVGAALGTVTSRFFVDSTTRRFGYTNTIALSMWLWAGSTTGLALTSNAAFAIAMFAVLGYGSGLWIAVNSTLRQQLTPDRMLGRMNAAFRMISWGIVPFGALAGGLVARLVGLRAPFVLAALVTLAYAVFAKRLLRPIRDIANPV
jgi:MFS family permease